MILAKWVFSQELPESSEHPTNTLPLGIVHSSENDDGQVFLLNILFYNVFLDNLNSRLM